MYSEQLMTYLYKYDLHQKEGKKKEAGFNVPVLNVLKGTKGFKKFATAPIKLGDD